ncbi:diguanylate cyclase (GGDEF)-like protein [Pseudomonas sp. TE3786]
MPSRQQLLRVRRILLASSASLGYLLLCWLAFAGGFMQLTVAGMLLLTIAVLASMGAFLALTWFNLNLRFHDPSLTLPQMGWAIGVIFVSVYFADSLRSLFLMMVLVVLMFGAFRLDLRGFIRIGLFTAVCYGLLMAALMHRGVVFDWHVEAIRAPAFFVLIAGVSMLGLEMSRLRDILQERNRDLQIALERIQQLAITDELTGLYNRRFANEVLDQQKALADRGTYDFVLCLIDLDFFKHVNDAYGHAGGDAVLCQLATILQRVVRDVDFVARMGGEEFLLVLSNTNEIGALHAMERLRQTLSVTQWEGLAQLRMTLSVGISRYISPEPWQTTMQRGDRALYQAKDNGRDQVVVL